MINKKIVKQIFSVLLLTLTTIWLIGCSKTSSVSEFTYWIANGEDSTYYSDYADNPSVKYWLNKFHQNDDEANEIGLEFYIPASGAQKDNFTTLIATGEYTDIMNLAMSTATASELHEESIALDITEYVESYMPNYVAFLDEHPDYKKTAMNYVDGEWKYLSLWNYTEFVQENFQGYTYRRDWIVNYGEMPSHIWDLESPDTIANNGRPKYSSYSEAQAQNDWAGWKVNPLAGQTFEADYGDDAYYDYVDNVVFPSGGDTPFYISDWEWMFNIFDTAHAELNITNSYHLSMYYPGYLETGDLYSGFGGGTPFYSRDENGSAVFGGTSDNFRVYLEALNNWYENGWIDQAFSERSSDMFFQIDQSNVRQGRVSMWQGNQSTLANQMDLGDGGLTEGIMAFGAPQPINDIYGDESNKMKEPDAMYQFALDTMQIIITEKAKDKDLVSLFKALDYLYSREGSRLVHYGLTKEQIDEIDDTIYAEHGLPNGAYEVEMIDGEEWIKAYPKYYQDRTTSNALKINRLTGLQYTENEIIPESIGTKSIANWDYYVSTARIRESFFKQMDAEQSLQYNKIYNNLNTFMSIEIPKFINGDRDISNDEDWDTYSRALTKYNPNRIVEILNAIFQRSE